eukprot:750441-Hanusia_phi.AAC.1
MRSSSGSACSSLPAAPSARCRWRAAGAAAAAAQTLLRVAARPVTGPYARGAAGPALPPVGES